MTGVETGYAAARTLFLAAAARRGARMGRHMHPTARGPHGEALFIDTAEVGPEDAPRQLVCLSGTHGAEGAAGSAAQTAWLDGDFAVPEGTAILLVHALNPWGFAQGSRVNENNVDLNRNFRDFAAPPPENPAYARLHAALCPPAWDAASLSEARDALRSVRAEIGEDAFVDALNRGQYTHPDGLIFGGLAPEWSNTTLRALLAPHVGRRRVVVLDLHTGLGRYGEPIFLSFDAEGSAGQKAARWTAEPFIEPGADPFEGAGQPEYCGLVCTAVADTFARGGAETCRMVVEFGTLPMDRMLQAVQLDRWLRVHADAGPEADQLRAEVVSAFSPDDPAWWDAVRRIGPAIIARAAAAASR